MTKKTLTVAETIIVWLDEDVGYDLRKKGYRLTKLSLKQQGGSWLGIICVIQDGEAYAAFVGAVTLTGLAKKLRAAIKEDTLRWRVDEFADRG